jgi:hypothetical protein
MGFIVSSPGTRMVYDTALREMDATNNPTAVAKLTQSYLYAEIPLAVGVSQYAIPILVNQNPYNNQSTVQKFLALQDCFFIGQLGVFLAVKASATDTSYQYYPYPSLYAGFTAAEQLAMNNFYNGWISLTVDQNVLITQWELRRHYCVNQTQGGAPASAPLDQVDYASDGFYPMEPNCTHIGSTSVQMQITLPSGITALPANTVAVIIHRGVKAQNVTTVNN